MDSITITREEFQKICADLLKEEMAKVDTFTGGNDVMFQIAVSGMAAKCYKKIELKLFSEEVE